VLARDSDVVPIPGTRNLNHLEENIAAVHSTVDEAHLRALDIVFASERRRAGASLLPD
jgi:aryl-alcohol dehydrogenase-like predicted oxidoreductase